MALYAVSFWKLLSDDTGHEADTLQYRVEIQAEDPGTAVETATQRFCRFGRIVRWSDHADEIRIREIRPRPFQHADDRELMPA